jgi:hypothetical protein
MTVWAQVFGALGVIGGIAVGVLLYYHRQTPAVWVTFTVCVLFSLWICLSWQNSINVKAGESKASPQQSKAAIMQDTSGDQSPNIIMRTTPGKDSITQKSSGTQSPNIITGEANLEVTFDTSHANRRNADNEQKK